MGYFLSIALAILFCAVPQTAAAKSLSVSSINEPAECLKDLDATERSLCTASQFHFPQPGLTHNSWIALTDTGQRIWWLHRTDVVTEASVSITRQPSKPPPPTFGQTG